MKIILISTYAHPVALGLRYISSCLKAAGHDVEMIFMSSKRDTAAADFTAAAIEALVERCRSADLLGMSLMTNTFRRACVLTETLRKSGNKSPIIWGGVHATVAPEESLEVADMVCIGEGEEPMRMLAEKMSAGEDPKEIGGIGFCGNGPFGNSHKKINPVMPLQQNLDDYPFPDYELHTHWVVEKGQLRPASPDNMRGTLHRFRIETTRGCPYTCNFCNNTAWQNIYKGQGPWVRMRSNDNVLEELEKALASFPTIKSVNILDDLFFVRNADEMRDFAEKYSRRINLPVQLDAHPNLITEEKLAALEGVPIALISMGIQSGSWDTLKNIYNRHTPLDKIIRG
ncbi:MAG: B12-binding domain-containing radical SAM protein, partial [Planctomycetota bacterium]